MTLKSDLAVAVMEVPTSAAGEKMYEVLQQPFMCIMWKNEHYIYLLRRASQLIELGEDDPPGMLIGMIHGAIDKLEADFEKELYDRLQEITAEKLDPYDSHLWRINQEG